MFYRRSAAKDSLARCRKQLQVLPSSMLLFAQPTLMLFRVSRMVVSFLEISLSTADLSFARPFFSSNPAASSRYSETMQQGFYEFTQDALELTLIYLILVDEYRWLVDKVYYCALSYKQVLELCCDGRLAAAGLA